MAVFLWRNPFEYSLPSRLLDQQFGKCLEPEHLVSPSISREFGPFQQRCPAGYARSWIPQASKNDSGSRGSFKNGFEANLDVQQFKPEEITVKVSENIVTVEGKHEEKEDGHGFVSRHFVRKYVLPENHAVDKLESKLSSDGILTITAPKKDLEQDQITIPITYTGEFSRASRDEEEMKADTS